MKRYLLPVIMFAGLITASAKKEIKQGNMRKESDTLRLIYPQWQGGVITS